MHSRSGRSPLGLKAVLTAERQLHRRHAERGPLHRHIRHNDGRSAGEAAIEEAVAAQAHMVLTTGSLAVRPDLPLRGTRVAAGPASRTTACLPRIPSALRRQIRLPPDYFARILLSV
jgi:hypothetical protein